MFDQITNINQNMYRSILYVLLAYLLYSCNFKEGSDINPDSNSIEDAHSAYFQMDHKTAYSIYNNVWSDSGQTIEHKSNAGRFRAKMDWLFYENPTRALKTIDSIKVLNHEPAKLLILKARILAGESNYPQAISASREAIGQGTSQTDKYLAGLAYCKYVFDKIKHDNWAIKDSTELEGAQVLISDMAKTESGDVDVAKLFLGYSLLSNKGISAFKAWMSYFRLSNIDQVHPSLVKSMPEFKASFLNYTQDTISITNTKKLIKGLAESGFYEYAVLVKTIHPELDLGSDREVEEIANYYDFLQKIDEHTIDFYLQTINGTDEKDDYMDLLTKEATILWDQLVWEEKKPDFTRELFVKEVNKRFKAISKLMHANGYFGLHMGHIVLDDRRVIDQYDQRADFRYISIDHMVSNGYSGWFWDGQAETGGWASDDESFLQVRSAYTSGPIRTWQKLMDSMEIVKTNKKIEELTIADDSLALENPYAFLPGLSARIAHHQPKQLLDSLRDSEITDDEMRLNFINSVERIKQGSSIYAHEGRHAIDKKNNYSRESEELEFTAKLSEIYFSEKPMWSFNAILSRNIGDNTSHGQANLRVIKGLVNWMEKNKGNLPLIDGNRPMLPQMDKLTEYQLKEAMKSLDPLAN